MVDLSAYTLTFDDEFNTRSISQTGAGTTWSDIRSNWRYDANSDIGFGHSSFVDQASGYDPFDVSGGVLTITAVPDQTPYGYPGSWESGLITTQGDFSQTYGYFEMRAQLSGTIGAWDAFWLLPDSPSTSSGWSELDIVEHYGSNEAGVYSALHTTDTADPEGVKFYSSHPGQTSGYHTYGVNWQADKIEFYFDGVLMGSRPTPSDMHGPMYILANLATQNKTGNDADVAGVPISTKIDYIRAYSKATDAVAVPLDTVSAPDGQDPGVYGARTASAASPTVCYASGTRILTVGGEVAVEHLRVGEFAVTAAGEARPIRWIGRRTIDCRDHPEPGHVLPVRIAAGALGHGRPVRDLFVSPGHGLCLDLLGEVLVPALALINGATITQVAVEAVTYWHVELDRHDILLAENLPAESYLDCGNRDFFSRGDGFIDPNRTIGSTDRYCRPFIQAGAVIDACRSQLARRALALGWRITSDMDMHLVVDGGRVEPDRDGDCARFAIPTGAREVVLVSDTFVPAQVSGGGDHRTLGLSISEFRISDGQGRDENLDIADLRFTDGFYPEEADTARRWRWTNGRLPIPAELWAGYRTNLILHVTSNDAGLRWMAPVRCEEDVVVPIVDRERLAA